MSKIIVFHEKSDLFTAQTIFNWRKKNLTLHSLESLAFHHQTRLLPTLVHASTTACSPRNLKFSSASRTPKNASPREHPRRRRRQARERRQHPHLQEGQAVQRRRRRQDQDLGGGSEVRRGGAGARDLRFQPGGQRGHPLLLLERRQDQGLGAGHPEREGGGCDGEGRVLEGPLRQRVAVFRGQPGRGEWLLV